MGTFLWLTWYSCFDSPDRFLHHQVLIGWRKDHENSDSKLNLENIGTAARLSLCLHSTITIPPAIVAGFTCTKYKGSKTTEQERKKHLKLGGGHDTSRALFSLRIGGIV